MVLNPKTGKMFCKDKCWLKGNATQQAQTQQPVKTEPKVDWEKVSRGKVKHGLVCAMIEKGYDLPRIKSELPIYVELVMGSEENTYEEVPFN